MSAAVTTIEVDAAEHRASVRLSTAQLAPRLISRSSRVASVALVAAGALLLPGDQVAIRIRVGAGCLLRLEDIGGTVAYGGRPERSRWVADIELEEGAALVWAAKPLIVADGAEVVRTTRARIADSAALLIRETTVLGRSGERGGTIRSRTIVDRGRHPLLAEGLHASGAAPQPGVLGAHSVFDAVVLAGIRPVVQTPVTMMLEGPGVVARHLGSHTHESPLGALSHRWTDELAAAWAARQENTYDPAHR
ncbi:MAG: urease accessory protein UreD [Microbacterium sp.]|uniref:urease accessory protein UreD n=1 Tax=Microbacterium sp. TaxID=51671 RepID=UPI001DF44B60|nr:urease accessory protein UreD [Microbacterium sp.]MBW8761950.1 urease accessory protein UreD [Microbacterium sp.]